MPANLTPEYERAERRHRQATTDDERLAALQEMLATIPKHKGTEKLQADLKRRLSQLRKDQPKTGQSKGPDPFHLPKTGAGQVVLVGPPNSGKSSLLTATTHAEAKVADYPFTTVLPQPGMGRFEDVFIELIDTPALTPEHVPTGLMGAIRNADIVCVVVEGGPNALDQVDAMLALLAARGLTLRTVPRDHCDPADPSVRPGLLLANKRDLAVPADLDALGGLYAGRFDCLAVSAKTGEGLEAWFQRLWQLLARVRVYAKQPGHPPDLTRPFTLPAGATVAELARLIHRDLPETMKFARLWGHSRFAGLPVHKTEVLQDKDIVEIHE